MPALRGPSHARAASTKGPVRNSMSPPSTGEGLKAPVSEPFTEAGNSTHAPRRPARAMMRAKQASFVSMRAVTG